MERAGQDARRRHARSLRDDSKQITCSFGESTLKILSTVLKIKNRVLITKIIKLFTNLI